MCSDYSIWNVESTVQAGTAKAKLLMERTGLTPCKDNERPCSAGCVHHKLRVRQNNQLDGRTLEKWNMRVGYLPRSDHKALEGGWVVEV